MDAHTNPVITAEQARKITGGRTPLVPVEYETACRALAECSTLDETKYWDNKADALAAWAKIYHSDQAAVEAKRLKLHAYRRMGALAAEIRPLYLRVKGSGIGKTGSVPGPKALLQEHGFKRDTAAAIRAIACMPQAEFEAAVAKKIPPSPYRLVKVLNRQNPAWAEMHIKLSTARGCCRRQSAVTLASGISPKECQTARELATELIEWLDEFERHLPREV